MHLSRPAIPPFSPNSGIGAGSLFVSASHREVAGVLQRGLARPGCVIAVTGEPGLGKTTLVQALLTELGGGFGPVKHVHGGTHDLLLEFQQFTHPESMTGRGAAGILVIDDAHTAAPDALCGLSRALDAAPPREAHPHLILVARPEFWAMLSTPALSDLRDRIDVRAVLFPLVPAEAEAYVEHLFRLAGSSAHSILKDEALHALILRAQGNFRQIHSELAAALAVSEGHQRAMQVRRGAAPALAVADAERSGNRRIAVASALLTVVLAGVAVLLPEPSSSSAALQVGPLHRASEPTLEAKNMARADQGAILARPQPRTLPDVEPPSVPALEPTPPPAPPEPALAVPPPPVLDAALPAAAAALPPPAEQPSTVDIAALLRQGDAMTKRRDWSAARWLYNQAAMAGSARGARLLGATYDPMERVIVASKPASDAALAAIWYQLAASLGDEEALARLKRLEAREQSH